MFNLTSCIRVKRDSLFIKIFDDSYLAKNLVIFYANWIYINILSINNVFIFSIVNYQVFDVQRYLIFSNASFIYNLKNIYLLLIIKLFNDSNITSCNSNNIFIIFI